MDFFPFQCGSCSTPHAERGATPLHHPIPATAVPTPHLGHPRPVLSALGYTASSPLLQVPGFVRQILLSPSCGGVP